MNNVVFDFLHCFATRSGGAYSISDPTQQENLLKLKVFTLIILGSP